MCEPRLLSWLKDCNDELCSYVDSINPHTASTNSLTVANRNTNSSTAAILLKYYILDPAPTNYGLLRILTKKNSTQHLICHLVIYSVFLDLRSWLKHLVRHVKQNGIWKNISSIRFLTAILRFNKIDMKKLPKNLSFEVTHV